MILYTPMQLELVLEGIEDMKHPMVREVELNGIPAVVEDKGFGQGKLVKLLSTDPNDYMDPNMIPGVSVNFLETTK
ncbi:MAG: hypothetical protein FH756_02795 [Firmicutes bacterium]|nr:hypothetical protein [Bacillota bacterium]